MSTEEIAFWSGLAGAGLGGGISILTAWLTNKHAARLAQDDRTHAMSMAQEDRKRVIKDKEHDSVAGVYGDILFNCNRMMDVACRRPSDGSEAEENLRLIAHLELLGSAKVISAAMSFAQFATAMVSQGPHDQKNDLTLEESSQRRIWFAQHGQKDQFVKQLEAMRDAMRQHLSSLRGK